jgi:uncharacterized protein
MMRLRWILLIAAALLAASAVAGVAQPRLAHTATTAPGKTITVTGTGRATAVPDRASLDFSVESRAATARAALAKNADEATAVVAALKNAGIPDDQIRTNYVSLSPLMNPNNTDIVGYSATNTVSVTTTLAKAGGVIDAAVAAGANGVSGPNLSIADEASLQQTALKNAVADAEAQAKVLASAASLSIVGVQSITEGTPAVPIFAAGVPASGVGKVSVPIQPGTQIVEATVTVTYDVS